MQEWNHEFSSDHESDILDVDEISAYEPKKSRLGVLERFVAQCVICVIILTVLVLTRALNPSGSEQALGGVLTALSQNITAADAREALDDMRGSLGAALGQTEPEEDEPATVPTAPSIMLPPAPGHSLIDDRNFRIDEDMLAEMEAD